MGFITSSWSLLLVFLFPHLPPLCMAWLCHFIPSALDPHPRAGMGGRGGQPELRYAIDKGELACEWSFCVDIYSSPDTRGLNTGGLKVKLPAASTSGMRDAGLSSSVMKHPVRKTIDQNQAGEENRGRWTPWVGSSLCVAPRASQSWLYNSSLSRHFSTNW